MPKSLSILQLIPDITGILSGRIRTDSMDHFFNDMLGIPSEEDAEKQRLEIQKQLFPDAKPGERWI